METRVQCTILLMKRRTCLGEDVLGGGCNHLLFWHKRVIQLRHRSQSGCSLSIWIVAASSLTNRAVYLSPPRTAPALSTGIVQSYAKKFGHPQDNLHILVLKKQLESPQQPNIKGTLAFYFIILNNIETKVVGGMRKSFGSPAK